MPREIWGSIILLVLALALLSACGTPNPQPAALTPIPTLAPGATPTLLPQVGGPPGGGTPGPGPGGMAEAALGAPLYSLHCSPCHGNYGQGADAVALRNNAYIQSASDQAIFQTIANGLQGTAMPAWLQANGGPLTQVDVSSVIDYLRTLQGVPSAPSPSGAPGPAASMTGNASNGRPAFGLYCAFCHGPEGVQGLPNPGSGDGSVPLLNPIDPAIASANPATFAANVDLYIEHGSVPSGSGPLLIMPVYGAANMLTQEQIADLIAYVLQLNGTQR